MRRSRSCEERMYSLANGPGRPFVNSAIRPTREMQEVWQSKVANDSRTGHSPLSFVASHNADSFAQQQQQQQREQPQQHCHESAERDTKKLILDVLEERVHERVRHEIDLSAEVVFESLKDELTRQLESKVGELESTWTRNPYMHVFDEWKRCKQTVGPTTVETEAAASASTAPPHDQSYRAFVQQIAYDFRRAFFDQWSNELRSQRPFMNVVQRNMLQQMVSDRFQYFESTMSSHIQDLKRQNQVLQAELANLRYMVMRQDVERRETSPEKVSDDSSSAGAGAGADARMHAQPAFNITPTNTPPPLLASGAGKPLSPPSTTNDIVDEWNALRRECFDTVN